MTGDITPYVNDDGDVWIERGVAPWAAICKEARTMLDMLVEPREPMRYIGIVDDVRVSEELEWPHGDDEQCAEYLGTSVDAPGFVPCCRAITAHHFRCEER